MTADPRLLSLWSVDELVPFPRESWLEGGIPEEDLPVGDEIPQDVAIVYTAQIEAGFELYDVIQLATDDGSLDIRLIALGAVATNPGLLYVMDPRTGEILQLDMEAGDIQGVNSTFRTFAEFLYQMGRFVADDEGKEGRAERAAVLADLFESIDPDAMKPECWWPLVISQLR
ncbi:hypothetical protein J3R03_003976 [Actinoplanes couchii]|uniref:SUKH-4 immunity protein n=1 Tax=Actinoplanes couchii TaxID=403638 RepID=A0ABQ3XEJ3_9ACTN|nr:SUKH-4 family immunity protein [Actinoplanes couchii]MDR6319780.1 hypothetical protein [Actinoplanes couchii]GID56915.1 hypothetical protein Aco03nite_053190 [Actinoplanes couchii]